MRGHDLLDHHVHDHLVSPGSAYLRQSAATTRSHAFDVSIVVAPGPGGPGRHRRYDPVSVAVWSAVVAFTVAFWYGVVVAVLAVVR